MRSPVISAVEIVCRGNMGVGVKSSSVDNEFPLSCDTIFGRSRAYFVIDYGKLANPPLAPFASRYATVLACGYERRQFAFRSPRDESHAKDH